MANEIDFGKRLGMGCLRLPQITPNDSANVDKEMTAKHIDMFMERGYNYFDTSYVYHDGNSESVLGELLTDRYPRDSFLISTKMPINFMKKAEDMESVFQEQLDRCHLDHFDFYLLHDIKRSSYKKSHDWKAWDFMLEKQAQGKFREFGVSVHDKPDFLDQMLTEHPEVSFVILQLNYLDWESDLVCAKGNYEVAVKHGKPIVAMEVCKGGTLSAPPEEAIKLMKDYNPDASIASWAYRFVGSLPGVRVTLAGMPKTEFLVDDMDTFDDFKPMNDDERDILRKVAEIINKNTAIPCTGCRYCEPMCPKKIPISEYFSLYNDYSRSKAAPVDNRVNVQFCYWQTMVINGATPAEDCIGCNICQKTCPQDLPISDLLKNKFVPDIEHHTMDNC